MPHFQKILVPTDFSSDAEAALAEAIDFARSFGGNIVLLHVHHMPVYGATPYGYTYPTGLLDEARQHAVARLNEHEQKVSAEGVKVTSELIDGLPSHEIVEAAKRTGADLIVMGTRGLTGLKHVLLGSVAERTLRHAPCPVMTVKTPEA